MLTVKKVQRHIAEGKKGKFADERGLYLAGADRNECKLDFPLQAGRQAPRHGAWPR